MWEVYLSHIIGKQKATKNVKGHHNQHDILSQESCDPAEFSKLCDWLMPVFAFMQH
jgi:hypothetical protein